MSTIADITDVIYMGRKIEHIIYMGREVELPPYIRPTLVGSKKLLDGTMEAGFFGEVSQGELIGSEDLFDKCLPAKSKRRITFNPSVSWLKFAYLNKIEYIAKQPICDGVTHRDCSKDNLVFGNTIITINDIKYRVRLIKGKTEGKQDDTTSFEGAINHYSEWNRLILPLIQDKNETSYKYPDNVEKDRLRWTGRYKEDDLKFKDASFSNEELVGAICQENIIRGLRSIENSQKYGHNAAKRLVGWRPVLEVVGF